MRTEIIHKVPNGKLLRIGIEFDTTVIHSIQINGDFFAHPEDIIQRFESALLHLPVESNPEKVTHLLDHIVAEKNARIIGFDTKTLAELICTAVNP